MKASYIYFKSTLVQEKQLSAAAKRTADEQATEPHLPTIPAQDLGPKDIVFIDERIKVVP